MPFDASIAARVPDIPARSPTAPGPTDRPEPRQAVAGGAPGHDVAPGESPAPAAVPFNAAVPFYSTHHPRPVSAIAPRLSRGVL